MDADTTAIATIKANMMYNADIIFYILQTLIFNFVMRKVNIYNVFTKYFTGEASYTV